MDTVEALQYKYQLNKYISACLKAGYSYESLWEYLITDQNFILFLGTRIGSIWCQKDIGKKYFKWATT